MRELMFNPYFEICALFILSTISVFFFKKEKFFDISSIVFGILIIFCFWDLIFDISSVFTITYSTILPLKLNYFINTGLFFGRIILVSLFFMYSMAITGQFTWKNRVVIALMLLPSVVIDLLVLSTPASKLFFYFDEAKNYHQGKLLPILYMICLFYILSSLVLYIKHRNDLNKTQLITIYSFIFLLLAAMLFQYYFPKLLISGFAVTLSVLMMYLSLQNPDYYVDKMTYLHNRQAFLLFIKQILSKNKKNSCFVLIDINGFKTINNLLGLHGGDIILIRLSEFLDGLVGSKKQVFRISGDRFAIVTDCNKADTYINQIQRRFQKPWDVLGSKLRISENVCKFPLLDDYISSSEDVMYLVENVLAYSKTLHANTPLIVDCQVVEMIKRRLAIENTLRSTEISKYLEICLQPIYSITKQKIVSAEALLRLNDPQYGLIFPDEFIPIAEQTGTINKIGRIVIERTCKFTDENTLWDKGIEMVGINLSTVQCLQENIAEYIDSIISKYPRVMSILNFEVTETTAATSVDTLKELMYLLSEKGVTFSMDDYGQGFSNCDSIINLPFHIVKLDKSLLWNSITDVKASIVYKCTIDMLKNMSIKIVAEGAETSDHIALLESYGVDYIQGYYFSKPLTKSDFLEYISDKNYKTTGSPL